jgi:predicted ATPase
MESLPFHHVLPPLSVSIDASHPPIPSPNRLVSPQQRYDDLVSRGVLRDDQDQRRIIARIQRLYEELVKHQPSEIPKSGNRGTGWVRCPGVPIAS